ncbi:MAG: hypothetical protein JNK14_02675 [Chitinophagaceae bacterium]|nr:hypothetical protein [Chitinophagaceae bacterium]
MKKWLIGSLVGAILVFLWHFLSWTTLGVHDAEAKYTPAQDSIISYLSSIIKEEGVYMLPTVPPGSSMDAGEALGKKMDGKPWATIMYKNAYNHDMIRPMIRSFLVDLFLVFTLIYILTRGGTPRSIRVVAGSVATGLFCFLAGPYTAHIWFQVPMEAITGHLIDSLVAWGLVGIWLGWWLNRK